MRMSSVRWHRNKIAQIIQLATKVRKHGEMTTSTTSDKSQIDSELFCVFVSVTLSRDDIHLIFRAYIIHLSSLW